MRTFASAFASLATAVALAAVTAPLAHAASGQSLNLTAGLSSYYHDNILQYSDGQLRDFESGLHPDRYAIETRDDLVINPSLALTWELEPRPGRRHALWLDGQGDFHQKNGIMDFRSLRAGWRESWSRDRRLVVSGYVLPRYYLRQLFDDDVVPAYAGLTRYRRADFRLQIASADWTQRITNKALLDLGYQYEKRDYNSDFDERDSGLHQGEIGVSFVRLPHRGRLRLGGGYRVSHARAEDGDQTEPVPDPDVSYHGMSAAVGGRMELARRGPWRVVGDLAYALETRSYDSDRPSDRYHFGREDILHAIELGLRTAYRPHWSLRGFYRLENNSATLGALAPLSADAGGYHANQAGLAIEWSGALWKQTASGSASDPEAQP